MKINKQKNAFTLTELLVVMGIMVLLSAILIPAIGPMFKGRAIKSSVQVVQGAVYKAKSLAAAAGANYYICFNNMQYHQNFMAIYDDSPSSITPATYENHLADEFILLTDTTMLYFDYDGNNSTTDGMDCYLTCLPTGEIKIVNDGTNTFYDGDASISDDKNDFANTDASTYTPASGAHGGVINIRVSNASSDRTKVDEFMNLEILELTGSMNVTEP